jgi:hypothetical protein
MVIVLKMYSSSRPTREERLKGIETKATFSLMNYPYHL